MDNITTGPTIGVSTQSVTAHMTLPPMPGLSGVPDLAGLEPMAPLTRRWPSYLGAAVTVVMIVWLALKLRALGVVATWLVMAALILWILFKVITVNG